MTDTPDPHIVQAADDLIDDLLFGDDALVPEHVARDHDDQWIDELERLCRLRIQQAVDRSSDAQARLRLASQASQIDRLDCTVREGGDTRHCPVNQQCQRCRLDALEAEKGKAYWRGFQQATYNRPGALSTANHIVAIEKELAEVKAQLTLAESSRASLEAENKELKVTTAWLLVETDKRGKQPKERIEGIALTHEAKDNFMRGWYEQGFSRTALPYKIHPKPLPPSSPSPQEPT